MLLRISRGNIKITFVFKLQFILLFKVPFHLLQRIEVQFHHDLIVRERLKWQKLIEELKDHYNNNH